MTTSGSGLTFEKFWDHSYDLTFSNVNLYPLQRKSAGYTKSYSIKRVDSVIRDFNYVLFLFNRKYDKYKFRLYNQGILQYKHIDPFTLYLERYMHQKENACIQSRGAQAISHHKLLGRIARLFSTTSWHPHSPLAGAAATESEICCSWVSAVNFLSEEMWYSPSVSSQYIILSRVLP